MTIPDRVTFDVAGSFRNLLKGYEAPSILREQVQNADDACIEQGIAGYLRVTFLADRLIFENPSVFNDDDWKRILTPGSGGKWSAEEQTGEFGVGFWSALHLTDAPIIVSGTHRVTVDPLGQIVDQVLDEAVAGSRFEFVYRTSITETAEQLDLQPVHDGDRQSFPAAFVDRLPSMVLFTTAVQRIELVLLGGAVVTVERKARRVADGLDLVRIELTDNSDAPRHVEEYLLLTTAIPEPPRRRRPKLNVALPLDAERIAPGTVYCTFPTETDSALNFSINAHFYATQDRRSLQHEGVEGAWNDEVFRVAGTALGGALPELLEAAPDRLARRDRLGWFFIVGGHIGPIANRAGSLIARVDSAARDHRVIPDRHDDLKRGVDLCILPGDVDGILGAHVAQSIVPPTDRNLVDLYDRWGVPLWGAREVATWLSSNTPRRATPRSVAPAFLRDVNDLVRLLRFCGDRRELGTAAMALGSDDVFHPLGSEELKRPAAEMGSLLAGLPGALLDERLRDTVAWTRAPQTTAFWLREQLLALADRVVGTEVGAPNVACLANLEQVRVAIKVITDRSLGLTGLPLAVDEQQRIQVFNDETLCALPSSAARKSAEALARRLGRSPLHSKVDDPDLLGSGVERFSPSLLVDLVRDRRQWHPVDDTRSLLFVLRTLQDAQPLSSALIERLRAMPIWPGDDQESHTLERLFLPPETVRRGWKPTRTLVAQDLLTGSGTQQCRATLHDVLNVDVYDLTEEIVERCEDPPTDRQELLDLLANLVHTSLSSRQRSRVQQAAFILCQDGRARRARDVLLVASRLPALLDRRRAADEILGDGTTSKLLERLGARPAPLGDELVEVAKAIAKTASTEADEGSRLWDFLRTYGDKYTASELAALRDVDWVVSDPDRVRRRPRGLLDPMLRYARVRFPVVADQASLPLGLREALGIRATLTAEELVQVGEAAAEQGHALDAAYFRRLDQLCSDDANQRVIFQLQDIAVVPLGRRLGKPNELVGSQKAHVWGHLKQIVPDQFVDDYPRLAEVWHIAELDVEIDWREHCDVLEHLAGQAKMTDLDQQLARQRIDSLAQAVAEEPSRANYLRRRPVVLTSKGLACPDEALRADLPYAVAERLRAQLAIAEEWDVAVTQLLDLLDLRSLRLTTRLEPDAAGVRLDEQWAPRLRVQALNLIRFLRTAPGGFPAAIRESWPPVVKTTASLVVRAFHDDALVNEWSATAHLGWHDEELVLYVIGDRATEEDVADAISSQFGLQRGTLELLEAILSARDAETAARKLDRNNIEPLPLDEMPFEFAQAEVVLGDEESGYVDDAAKDEDRADELHDEPEAGRNEMPPAGSSDTSATTKVEQAEPDEPYATLADEEAPPRPQPPRVRGDDDSLEDRGYEVVRTWDPEIPDYDYADEHRPIDQSKPTVKVCLDFYEVMHGFIPVRQQDALRLAQGVPVKTVYLFGADRVVTERTQRYVAIKDGARLFAEREVVAGTVVWLHASEPGRIEAQIREQEHEIADVWMLEIENGRLIRHKAPAVTVRYETDGPLYKSERRWEDLDALYEEADRTASCRDLLLKVFEAEAGRGFTVDEAWAAVAMYRLFARATVARQLSYQDDAFELRDDHRYYLVGKKIKKPQQRSTPVIAGRKDPQVSHAVGDVPDLARRARDLARSLASLLQQLTTDDISAVAHILGLRLLEQPADLAFEQACLAAGEAGDSVLIERVRAELDEDPSLIAVALTALESMPRDALLRAEPIATKLAEIAPAAELRRAKLLADRLEPPSQVDDPLVAARAVLDRDPVDRESAVSAIVRAIELAEVPSADTDPSGAWAHFVARNRLVEQYARHGLATDAVWDARNRLLGRIARLLPADSYPDVPRQELRATLRLLTRDKPLSVFDSLTQLAELHEASPTGSGDAALVYQLAAGYASVHDMPNKTKWARAHAQLQVVAPASTGTIDFARTWCELLNVKPAAFGLRLGGPGA